MAKASALPMQSASSPKREALLTELLQEVYWTERRKLLYNSLYSEAQCDFCSLLSERLKNAEKCERERLGKWGGGVFGAWL